MALTDRLGRATVEGIGGTQDKIHVNDMLTGMTLQDEGIRTRAQVLNFLGVQANEEQDYDELFTWLYTGTVAEQAKRWRLFRALMITVERDKMDTTEFRSILIARGALTGS